MRAFSNHQVFRCCNSLCLGAETEIDLSVAKDTMFILIKMYVRVRSFSKANKLIEQYKEKTKSK